MSEVLSADEDDHNTNDSLREVWVLEVKQLDCFLTIGIGRVLDPADLEALGDHCDAKVLLPWCELDHRMSPMWNSSTTSPSKGARDPAQLADAGEPHPK